MGLEIALVLSVWGFVAACCTPIIRQASRVRAGTLGRDKIFLRDLRIPR